MKPAEFWELHPVEFWWLVDAHRSQGMVGSMREGEVEDLIQELEDEGFDTSAVTRKRRKERKGG
jgi:hypothetical protein